MEKQPIDPDELSFDDGVYLVKLARRTVAGYFQTGTTAKPSQLPEILKRPGASFVTVEEYIDGKRNLRGCIGYVKPVKPLYETVMEVALQAAFNDPRFPPLKKEELTHVTFEVSVLSIMEEAPKSVSERRKFVKIGRDGLMVSYGIFSGLLLPQVPVEYKWDVDEFLSQTCLKAGLDWNCWMNPQVEVYRFRARIWREKTPEGDIEERDLYREWLEK